ncbi:MAG: rhodanese-like domain-containing protein [Cyclobacteriaceae bacterium]|nr:rhodanese-like domain-containing protein [Cyclobacteriaceae bacterium]MCH8515668.1 rhodanese-like domain-containing protein [Cyclobacteriaceae bacterium]
MFNLFNTKPKAYSDISADDFSTLMSEKNTVVLDVRTAGEFQSGKIKGAKNIDIMDAQFMNKINKLPKDKNYLVYCRSGNRSGQACSMMAEAGFTQLNNLKGGIMRWSGELN